MAKLISQTVEIGRDAYGRPVRMTRRTNYDGKIMWDIVSDALSQRDEGEKMTGLTDENIRGMVQALNVIAKS